MLDRILPEATELATQDVFSHCDEYFDNKQSQDCSRITELSKEQQNKIDELVKEILRNATEEFRLCTLTENHIDCPLMSHSIQGVHLVKPPYSENVPKDDGNKKRNCQRIIGKGNY